MIFVFWVRMDLQEKNGKQISSNFANVNKLPTQDGEDESKNLRTIFISLYSETKSQFHNFIFLLFRSTKFVTNF